jgi:hypothetical protein
LRFSGGFSAQNLYGKSRKNSGLGLAFFTQKMPLRLSKSRINNGPPFLPLRLSLPAKHPREKPADRAAGTPETASSEKIIRTGLTAGPS